MLQAFVVAYVSPDKVMQLFRKECGGVWIGVEQMRLTMITLCRVFSRCANLARSGQKDSMHVVLAWVLVFVFACVASNFVEVWAFLQDQ